MGLTSLVFLISVTKLGHGPFSSSSSSFVFGFPFSSAILSYSLKLRRDHDRPHSRTGFPASGRPPRLHKFPAAGTTDVPTCQTAFPPPASAPRLPGGPHTSHTSLPAGSRSGKCG